MVKARLPGCLVRSPVLASGLFCCLLTALLVRSIEAQTEGMFVYPLDDSYIHLALARTLASHHVWGMSSSGFASASSSPGWTILLAACDVIFGSHLLAPLLLNLLLVFFVLGAADYAIRSFVPPASLAIRYLIAFVLVVAVPLPNLALIGMEHVAQTLGVLLLFLFAARVLSWSSSTSVTTAAAAGLLASAALAGAIRYEAVIAIFPVVLLLFLRKRYLLGTGVALASAIGPLTFGVYSHHVSGFWLPFSVLAKAALGGGIRGNLAYRLHGLLDRHSPATLLWTMLPLWLTRLRRRGFWNPTQTMLLLSLSLALVHMLIAPIGWLMRYESYFFFLSLLSLCLVLAGSDLRRLLEGLATLRLWEKGMVAAACCGAIVLVPHLFHRSVKGFVEPVKAAVDRYNEHIQMAEFILRNYDNSTVVVNDIGAIAYYSKANLLDMVGLGSVQPLLAIRQHGQFTSADMEQWEDSAHAEIAIVQSDWSDVRKLIPRSWTLVETWQLPRNIVFTDLNVSFYAVDPNQINRLCESLGRFKLPAADRIVLNRCQTLP